MSNKESTTRTLLVALAVSLVSSVFVAGAAVSLKPVQIENRLLDKQRSILSIAGLASGKMSAREVKSLFAERIAKVVDLDTGEYTDKFNPTTFDPLKAARDPKLSEALPGDEDPALIKRRGALHDGLYRREGRQARVSDPANSRIRPVVDPARLHRHQERSQHRGGSGLLSACRNPGPGRRGR